MKFMHISDVHLGAEPDAGREWSKKRTQDIWDSFAETVLEAGRQKVDFLFISGDLFHKQPLKRELKEVAYLFEQIQKVKIVFMAGNHDYLQPKSHYLNFEWSSNVFFFSREEITCFDFEEENVAVYGMSYWHRQISERIYDTIEIEDKTRINILLAHGGAEKQIPFLPKQILGRGIDYIAAGHIHKASMLAEGKAVMAGALEPIECNETGPHGYWIGEIQKKNGQIGTEINFFPIKKCEYCHETILVKPEMTQYELEKSVNEIVAEGESYMRYRIFLDGYEDEECSFDLSRIEQISQVVDVVSRLLPKYDYKKLWEEQPESLLGRYIASMEKQSKDVVTKKALEYGVKALLGHSL